METTYGYSSTKRNHYYSDNIAMPRITPIHWKKFEKFLFVAGCVFKREKGDHRIYWRVGLSRPIVLPRDSELPVFVIQYNLRLLGMSKDQYLEILENI